MSQVRLLTLNCWGLLAVSKLRKERIQEIARRLSTAGEYDIIILQELWVDGDFEIIKQSVKLEFPFYKRFYSGILAGPGLTVFSRWPIDSAWLFRFPINGRPSAFWRGDWFVGKSCGSVVVNHPSGHQIEILNAHMHAPYGPGDANYTCHRAAQAWEMSRIARRACEQGHVVFVAGDLNSVPGSPHYELFTDIGGLKDAWVALHGEFQGNVASLTPQEQIDLAGVTADSQLNSWRASYAIERAKRLDYIFFDPRLATPTNVKVAMTEQSPKIGSVSDHFGLSAVFQLHDSVQTDSIVKVDNAARYKLLDDILLIIGKYHSTCKWQAKWRNTHFWISIACLVGLLVGVWWAGERNRGGYVGFIFILASIALTATGLTNGFIGFLFGRNEARALKEFEDEVWLAKRQL